MGGRHFRATTARLAAVNLHPQPGARTTDFVPAPWDVLAPGIPRPFQCQGPEYEVSFRVCTEHLFDKIHQPEEPHLASCVVLGNAWYWIT